MKKSVLIMWRTGILSLFIILVFAYCKDVFADVPTPDTQVEDIVTDPGTGLDAKVISLIQDDDGFTIGVVTDADRKIITPTNLGDVFPATDENGDWTVTATTTNSLGYVDQITIERTYPDPEDNTNTIHETKTLTVAEDFDSSIPPDKQGEPGVSERTIYPPSVPTDNSNYIYVMKKGACGAGGSDGFGIRVCIFGWCVTLGVDPAPGQDGSPGPDVTINAPSSHGTIETVSGGLAGITGVSIGGDGGQGGDSYGNIDAAPGGAAGDGGAVTIGSDTIISTSGEKGHGIFAQSQAGKAGDGGTGYIWSGGGHSGVTAHGGTVTVTNGADGLIGTRGDYAHGIFAQSIGGAAGTGGSSWGIVGEGGSSLEGGDGGSVNVSHRGGIITLGRASHGIFAQSIGGTGGDGGGGGGIVGLGGDGSAGGDGGSVVVSTEQGSQIQTHGLGSHGILAQSIGGGGGNGGLGAGIVGLGASGSGGGKGGEVTVSHDGSIITSADGSYGILAQSIGGGGGNAGIGAGLVGIGATGDGGGSGGSVNVSTGSSAFISTNGRQSHGIFAQSVGGGGGTGGIGAGVVAIGGRGGSGGMGGPVNVNNAGQISTRGEYSRGIFAQSVGGGGGDGAGAGGVLSIGGSGSEGGSGGDVTVENSGNISTRSRWSQAIFAQSIGGGGGSASTSGSALVTIGGSGGAGGNSGRVSVTSTEKLETMGDDSPGILAQSVGGGGGNGGSAIAGSLLAGVSIGGSGGTGGNGSDVSVTVNPSALGSLINTQGDRSDGIFAQSIGGGGGNGGFAATATACPFTSLSVGIGGDGGDGGSAGKVNVDARASILTEGHDSNGILAQSVGGGGGNAGMAVAGSVQINPGAGGIAIGVALGGTGGSGGAGDTVSTSFSGNISTQGDRAKGLIAQSVGGGGGSGGFAISVSLSAGGTASGAIAASVGGSGGGGGNGAAVSVDLDGNVSTLGDNAGAVIAQSVGGGGGSGGFGISAPLSGASAASGAIAVGVGGSGGGGGSGGSVTAHVSGNVATQGKGSDGILLQSVGGGGGNGGFEVSGAISGSGTGSAAVSVGVGGAGGSGGNGNSIGAFVDAAVSTFGDRSAGVVAQSVGGGGGTGGFDISGTLSMAGEGNGAVAVGVGGSGGDGGNGGTINLTLEGSVDTHGEGASAVMAQSIGGGGGRGGFDVAGTIGLSINSVDLSAAIGMGGFGGQGGDSSAVSLEMNGDVSTSGTGSHGVIAQSIGGGGGSGGLNISGAVGFSGLSGSYSAALGLGGFGGAGGNAGRVDVNVGGDVLASIGSGSNGSNGILAQSVGGGGGCGNVNIAGQITAGHLTTGNTAGLVLGVGGFGGGGGEAADVSLTVNNNQTMASGLNAGGIVAQSLGGGGGNGGLNVGGSLVADGPVMGGVGGFGGQGGSAGEVSIQGHSHVTAQGDRCLGVAAQSIGGGGGNGAINVDGSLSVSRRGALPSLTFGLGGFGGSGNTSGKVSVDYTGSITTQGQWAHGLLAQSIAGGGGNGGMNIGASLGHSSGSSNGTDMSIVVGIGGHGGAGADAGDVEVTDSGDIQTRGPHSNGIIAQSIGGGGGNGGMNVSAVLTTRGSPIVVGIGGFGDGGGQAGTVTVSRGSSSSPAGSIHTEGEGSAGIEASSIGGGGGDAGMNFLVSLSPVGGSGTQATPPNPWSGKVNASTIDGLNSAVSGITGGGGGAASSSTYSAQIAIGGFGAEAGDGNVVDVSDFSEITCTGKRSYGILAQSIGGGGGNATFNLALGYSPSARSAKVAVGGATGDGGNGDEVSVSHAGEISTDGADAAGIIAQSIGGGGGNAGFDFVFNKSDAAAFALSLGRTGGSGGSGGDVDLDSKGSVATTGDNAYGLLAQSIGGGGGNSSVSSFKVGSGQGASGERAGSVSIGLEGGRGGSGGNVSLSVQGAILTQGTKAHGVFAQSVGGGGGNGGNANAVAITAPSVGVSVGGTGGQGGIGQTVVVSSGADIQVNGEEAVGVLAQSIGGGGGTGGASFTGGLKTSGSGIQVTVGGTGGSGNKGGQVSVDNSGTIVTGGRRGHGILAQSLGGGGGNGGIVINGLRGSSQNSTRVFVSVGGSGGSGAVGDRVTVTNTGTIQTQGEQSAGILAQSIGGGGGTGSNVITGSLTFSQADTTLGINIGGQGGQGGKGGDVLVENLVESGEQNSGLIYTEGKGAHGVMALSIGGGGGTGSTVISATNSFQKGTSPYSNVVAVSVGGSGGSGGSAGKVTALNQGSVITKGDEAHGIVAESIGGGGGNGGVAITGNVLIGGTETTGMNSSIAVGGSGGNGNNGNDVLVENDGSIETYGKRSYGIFAQSIGGGGGNGASSIAISIDPTIVNGLASQATFFSIGVGGSGGDGADAGEVTVNHNGTIQVNGDNSFGIFAQSVGGGGGTSSIGYSSPFWMAGDLMFTGILGAKDSSNGKGSAVTVTSTGSITTRGADSKGVFWQSVNGGGGRIGMYLDISQDAASLYQDAVHVGEVKSVTEGLIASFEGIFGLGCDGGADNAGGTVAGSQNGDILTGRDRSPGMAIQSIGGGGGEEDITVVARPQADLALSLNLGGKNGGNDRGGDITVRRNGSISTHGHDSVAMSIQSIGGGGGSLSIALCRTITSDTGLSQRGGGSVSVEMGSVGGSGLDGGRIYLNMAGDLSTDEDPSTGILVQSVGAGGGLLTLRGEDHADVTLGGQSGASGNGGDIEISTTGEISTNGDLSHGMLVQSIGGGGGAIFTGLQASEVGLTLSSHGTGNGGNINIAQIGNISTGGASSFGVFIQSIGGGGGIVDDRFAGSAGGSGDAGAISLNLTGNVTTTGEASTGIFMQSQAGSGRGGHVGLSVTGAVHSFGNSSPGINLSSSGGAGTGSIDLVLRGDVQTTGDQSPGILVESTAGTGQGEGISIGVEGDIFSRGENADGIRVLNAGADGAMGHHITVDIQGNMAALGEGSSAIYIESVRGAADCSVNITMDGDMVIGGRGTGTGVSVIGGGENSITNNSVLTTVEELDGTAILSTTGDDLISNNGRIIGNVRLGPGANMIRNSALGSILSGDMVDMGANGMLMNSGIISPGGADVIQTTNVVGDIVQTSEGAFQVTLDFEGNQADRINQSGTAHLEGSVDVETLNPARLLPGKHKACIMSSTQGINNDALELDVQPSAVVQYYLRQPSENDLDLHFDIDFSPQGLSKNQGSIGQYFNDVQLAGGSPAMDPYIVKLFQLPDLAALQGVYEPLVPDFYDHFTRTSLQVISRSADLVSMRLRNLEKMGRVYSSSSLGRVLISNGSPVLVASNDSWPATLRLMNKREEEQKYGVWMNVSGLLGDASKKKDFSGYEYDSVGISGGFDAMIGKRLFGGLALSTGKTDLDVRNQEGGGDIRSFFGSLYAGYFTEDLYLNGIFSYGRHNYHTDRYLNLFSVPTHTTSKHHGESWSFYGENGYLFELYGWNVKPYIGIEFSYLGESKFQEDGAGAMSLIMKNRYTKALTSDLGVHWSRNFKLGKGVLIPELTAAWNHDFNIDDNSLVSSFAGFPAASFSTEAPAQGSDGVILCAGISFAGTSGITSQLRCNGEWREGYRALGIVGEICFRF